MLPMKNLNNKRVCDISENSKAIRIQRKDVIAEITASMDGTLKIVFNEKAIRKRIFDISKDKKLITIRLKNCLTYITARKDLTLEVKHNLDMVA